MDSVSLGSEFSCCYCFRKVVVFSVNEEINQTIKRAAIYFTTEEEVVSAEGSSPPASVQLSEAQQGTKKGQVFLVYPLF